MIARAAALRVAMLVLALAGLADSLYLTWYHYDPAARVCLVVRGCEVVNTSPYAMAGPIPVAVLGVMGYLLIAVALLLHGWGPLPLRTPAGYALYGLCIIGTGFALYLTGIEVFVLHALCTWCILSAIFITGVCVLATLDLAEAS